MLNIALRKYIQSIKNYLEYKMTKLNIGGGQTLVDGFLNLDLIPYPEVDIVCDLNKKLPFPDSTVDEIRAFHVLEHVDDLVFTLSELHRISKPGAVINMKSPYYKSKGAFKDPTHKVFFTDETFDYFDPNIIKEKNLPDYRFNARFKVLNRGYIWSNNFIGPLPFKHFLKNHLWNIARTIYFDIEVIK